MKITREEILNAIVSSKVLEKHSQENPFLDELMNNANNPNIHYGREFISTIYQREVFERRVKIMVKEDADELSKTNATAFQKAMMYIEKYPENHVFTVTFNCNNEHFTVWCGLLDNHIEVLCVMKGGHIQDYAFEKPIK